MEHDRSIGAALVLFAASFSACAADAQDPADGSTSSSSDEGTSTSEGEVGTVATDGVTASSSSDATSTDTSGVPGCSSGVAGTYASCADADAAVCGWMGTGESTGYPSCLQAALVEGGSVCSIIGCVDRCDCFAPPATGTATVECIEGVVADDTACVLYCGGGEVCPDGMQCSVQTCVWPPR
jgi:hypothetical protein